jgi:pimeloyl-ACP methyl ester carboxylesterase
MSFLRAILNVVLAIITVGLIALLLLTGYGLFMSRLWETEGLDYGALAPEGEPAHMWLWLGGEPISYRMWGVRPGGAEPSSWVVLVHGLQVEGSETWAAVARQLARRGAQVLTVDLRGMGRSVRIADPDAYTVRQQANLLAIVLNELQIHNTTVVGQGWGAAVVLQMAYEQPQFVDQIVLVAPQLEAGWEPWWRELVALPYVGRAAVWVMEAGGPWWEIEQHRFVADTQAAPEGYYRRIRQATHVVGTQAAWRAMTMAPPDSDLPEALSRIEVPTMVLWGEEDVYLGEAEVQRLATGLPQAQVISIAEAGHYIHVEQALDLAQRIDLVRR